MSEVTDPTLLGLTPLDHLPAKLFLPYILYFETGNPKAALNTLEKGLSTLVSQIPWLAGDVILHSAPGGPKNRLHIAPPRSPTEVKMLQVKYFETDEEFRAHNVRSYLPLSTFIPASKQRPVLRFQANVLPTKIALAMSFWHSVFDGTGAGVILEMLAECCKADHKLETPLVSTVASNHDNLRRKVSAFPSKCQIRLDHSRALGNPVFDSSVSTEQWDAMESAIASAIEKKRFIFSSEKVAKLKESCTHILSDLEPGAWVSSNDIITAVLAISVDRVLHPERADKTGSADFPMAVDLRGRVNPPLPQTYLGNAIYPVHDDIYFDDPHQVEGEDADLHHLARLALRVRSTLASMDENLVYSASAEVAEHDDWTQIDASPANIIVTSWRNLKVFSLDFGEGLGYIEDFEPGLALVPGGCIFLPERASMDGSAAPWEVCVTLTTGVSEILVRDSLFSRILE